MIEKISSTYGITKWMQQLFENWHVSNKLNGSLTFVSQLFLVLLFTYLSQYVARKIIVYLLKKIGRQTRLKFATYLLDNRFPTYIALIAPLIWLKNTIPVVFENFPHLINLLIKLSDIFIVLMSYWLVDSILKSIALYLNTFKRYRDKPIESYFQIVRIVIMILLIGTFFTILTGVDMLLFFKTMGAASAILLLVFKDSILGFVSSVQVTTNDMVRIGDWITIPKHNADGNVIQITLNTVKIQNFDKTITTVPTYSLISDSFQNWKGMQLSGGRRIKRSIIIKQSTIRYIEDEEIPLFEQIQGIQQYMEERQNVINSYNEKTKADRRLRVNGRNMTNIGLYRKYIENFLKHHPNISQDMMVMAREQQATEVGLPIEIYCFTNTTVWEEYENIMADIFDHLVAAVKFFDLEVFERSSMVVEKNSTEIQKVLNRPYEQI